MKFIIAFLFCVVINAQTIQFSVGGPKTSFPHFWEGCVGSGHATLSLREDWRNHLRRAHNELGFKMVRFHGLLDDDMSTSLSEGVNSYLSIDSMIDFLLSIGMKPILEISFMPTWLASGNATICHYKGNITPPSDYDKWGTMIKSLAEHLHNRYGEIEISQWYIEVWNEPGVAPTFWTGTKEDYFHLYLETANAFKSVSSKFRVGGPATDCCAAWISDLISFCGANNVSVDFISTHTYSGGDTDVGQIGPILDALQKSKAQAGDLPLIITEWSSTYVDDYPNGCIHDDPVSAPFLVATMESVAGLPDIFSYWTFTDIFEESGFPTQNISFHSGFGLLTFYGVPKPAYRAFQLLHQGGDYRVPVKKNGPTNSQCYNTLGMLPLVNETSILLLSYNYNGYMQPIQDCPIIVTINDLKNPHSSFYNGTAILIDENNCNPKAEWIKMGMPNYLTQTEIAHLEKASVLKPVPLSSIASFISSNGNTLTFQTQISASGLMAITLGL